MEGLIIGRNLAFQNGLGLTIKTASANSPWAYTREGLLSERFVRLKFGGLFSGGLIFGGAYCRVRYSVFLSFRCLIQVPHDFLLT